MPKEGRGKQVLDRKEVKSEEMRLGSKEQALPNPVHGRWKRSGLSGRVTAQGPADVGAGLFPWSVGWCWVLNGENTGEIGTK